MSDTRRLREHRVQPWPRWRRADRKAAGEVHESRAPRYLVFVGGVCLFLFLTKKPDRHNFRNDTFANFFQEIC